MILFLSHYSSAIMFCCVFVLIIFSFATPIASIGNYSHICRLNTSSHDVFKCVQGSECIDTQYVCDGTKDCSDGSDEDSCFTRIRRQFNSCILPPYPDHGSYEILDDSQTNERRPGESLSTFALKVSCEQGYGMTETHSDVDTGGTLEVLCVNGRWSPNMPKCVRFCKLNADPSVHYMCTGSTICKKFVSPESLVKPICNSPVYYSTETLLYMKCLAGSWNYVAKCKPDCGRVTPGGVQLLIDGTSAKRGELPWHVGVYRKTKPYMQICGGSLITNDVVISAAHCFWSDTKKLLPALNFAVAIGKLYRPWDDPRDPDAQKSDIKNIAIPKLFRGSAANFQEDIAVLTLTASFIYETYIRPVCLSFDDSFDRWHLQHGNLGKVAGWGLTAANGVASTFLNVVSMPFINEATCVNTLPQSFTAYITGDKFCAGYTNGTALCKGDSGGGITFADREQGLDRYYLRGIVSTAPTTDDKLCNDRSYTTFTKVTKHENFIQNALAVALADYSCAPNMFHCPDGTCRDYEANCGQKYEYVNKYVLADPQPASPTRPEIIEIIKQKGLKAQEIRCCSQNNKKLKQAFTTVDKIDVENELEPPMVKTASLPVECTEYSERFKNFCRSAETIDDQFYLTGSRNANRGEFPHMALLGYGRNYSSAPHWDANGFVISERFILTAAQLLIPTKDGNLHFAALGVLKRTDPPEYWKIYLIKRRMVHPSNRRLQRYNDIGLLQTETEIIFDATIMPICLDVGTTDTSQGWVTGWGYSRQSDDKPADTMKMIYMKEQSNSTCKATFKPTKQLPNGYDETTMMCYFTISLNGPCEGDTGDPLQALDRNCLYTAIGIVSHGDRCGSGERERFTRISPFIGWIEDVVW